MNTETNKRKFDEAFGGHTIVNRGFVASGINEFTEAKKKKNKDHWNHKPYQNDWPKL